MQRHIIIWDQGLDVQVGPPGSLSTFSLGLKLNLVLRTILWENGGPSQGPRVDQHDSVGQHDSV